VFFCYMGLAIGKIWMKLK